MNKPSNRRMTIKKIMKMMEKNQLNFDFPIQRESGQWSKEQKSLFIDSLIQGYDIPDIYILDKGKDSDELKLVIDGNQRLHTCYEFYKDKFKMSKSMDDIEIDGVKHNISGLKYSELPQELQDCLNDYDIGVTVLNGLTEDEIEEQFYRLNNGSTFTKAQQANVKLGSEIALKVKDIEECNFLQNRAVFSNSQRKRGEVTSCVLQTLMLLTGFEYRNLGANEVLRFAEYFNENTDYKQLEYCKELFDKLWNVLPGYDKEFEKQFKKIHIPVLIMNLDAVSGLDVKHELTDEEYADFLSKWITLWCDTSGYEEFCGAGSTSRTKVEGRIAVMERELREYALRLSNDGGNSNGDSEEYEDENNGFEAAS